MSKHTLQWYEDSASEIKVNDDGSVTFVFDEPYLGPSGSVATSSTTIKKEDYEAAKKDPTLEV